MQRACSTWDTNGFAQLSPQVATPLDDTAQIGLSPPASVSCGSFFGTIHDYISTPPAVAVLIARFLFRNCIGVSRAQFAVRRLCSRSISPTAYGPSRIVLQFAQPRCVGTLLSCVIKRQLLSQKRFWFVVRFLTHTTLNLHSRKDLRGSVSAKERFSRTRYVSTLEPILGHTPWRSPVDRISVRLYRISLRSSVRLFLFPPRNERRRFRGLLVAKGRDCLSPSPAEAVTALPAHRAPLAGVWTHLRRSLPAALRTMAAHHRRGGPQISPLRRPPLRIRPSPVHWLSARDVRALLLPAAVSLSELPSEEVASAVGADCAEYLPAGPASANRVDDPEAAAHFFPVRSAPVGWARPRSVGDDRGSLSGRTQTRWRSPRRDCRYSDVRRPNPP